MKGWNGFLLLAIALGLLMAAACSRGVSQTEYDKARADLATAQGQAKELETQLGSAKASLDKANADLAQAKSDSDKAKADLATAQARVQSLQNDYTAAIAERDRARNDLVQVRADSDKAKADLAAAQARAQKVEGDLSLALAQARDLQTELGSAKASLDKARADMQKVQGLLTTAQSYAKIADLLFLDSYRQDLLIRPSYQYTEARMLLEVTRAVEASNDPVLKALWDGWVGQGPLETFGAFMLLYQPIAMNSILNEGSTPAVFPPALIAANPSPTGQTLLQVKLATTDSKPIPNVEIGLWREASPPDPPDAGVTKTDASGTASFTLREGVYWIDFNPSTAPQPFGIPSGRMVLVVPGMVTQVEITAFNQ